MTHVLCRIGIHKWGEVTWIGYLYPVVWCRRCNKKRVGVLNG